MSERPPAPGFPVALRLSPAILPEDPSPLDHRLPLLPERSRKALATALATAAPFHAFLTVRPEVCFEGDLGVLLDAMTPPSAGVDLVAVPGPADPADPFILELPAGKGVALRDAVDSALRSLTRRLARLQGSDGLRATERSLGRTLESRSREAISSLETRARDLGFGVRTGNGTLQTFPILHGKPVSTEQLSVLDEATRKRLSEAEDRLTEIVDAVASKLQGFSDETDAARDDALQQAAEDLVTEELSPARAAFASLPQAAEFLEMLAEDLRGGWRDLLEPGHPLRGPDSDPSPGRRYGVHVLLATDPEGPPHTEFLPCPSARDLFGTIVVRTVNGVVHADFASLRPGALVRCARGVLVLRAIDLLRQPELWGRLRRSLLTGSVELEGPPGCYLQPRTIPISPRVLLVGPEELHSELTHGDPDFLSLFPLKIEVEELVERTDTSVVELDAFLTARYRGHGHLPLDRSARARLIDIATRVAEDRQKISLALPPTDEVVALASDAVRRQGRSTLTAADIDESWSDRRARRAGAALAALRQVTEGVVLIETEGRRVGVVNGLAVFFSADLSFGQPMRLTAVVSPGTEGVVDVEREAHLGGDVHTKGVAILRGLLSRLFGQERPLSLRAQITFEQSYGEVDGDSASSAEFFAILSALADVPVLQSLAVTGAISQLGEIQAIGGVCDKIEGFYDLCEARGLSGSQGVIIPRSNLRHLVLRDDIAAAVEEGRFHIHPIESVQQGIQLLTGISAGERDGDGKFPAASVFGRAERRLIELAERLRASDPNPPDPLGLEADIAPPGDASLRRSP